MMHTIAHAFARAATNIGLAVDSWTRWSIFDSRPYERLHARLISELPEREALPIRELDAERATRASVAELSEDYMHPIVIRGALADSPCLESWGQRQWWLDHYGDAEVLGSKADVSRLCSVREALTDERFYVAGAASIFKHHPELVEMVENGLTRSITPNREDGIPEFYQLFLGHSLQGTTIHCALTINLFRQISGRKKWYFLPPSQTPYLRAKVYTNGFSATSKTIQPHGEEAGSPWFGKLERFTVTLEPGDLLLNPPWWWHGVENLPGDELIVGVATRFVAGPRRVLRVDPFKTALAFSRILTSKTGVKTQGAQDPEAYERGLIANRSETDQQLILGGK